MEDLEKKVSDFKQMLDFEDPVLLQKAQFEMQLEMMRLMLYTLQDVSDKLSVISERIDSMDWKLWEIAKKVAPELNEPPSDTN